MMLLLILFNSIDESIFCLYCLLSSLLLIMYMMIDGVIYVNNVVVWLQSKLTTNLVICMVECIYICTYAKGAIWHEM